MSCSVSRNSLGTVVECAEGAENEPGGSAGVATSSRLVGESYEEEEEGRKCARLTEQLVLIEKQTKLEEEMTTGARGDPSRIAPKTTSHGALRGDRSPRRGPFSISRLNLISFLNNIATPSAPVSRHPIARSAVRRRTTQEQPTPDRAAPPQPHTAQPSQSSRCTRVKQIFSARHGSSTSRSQSASITSSIVSSLGTSHEQPKEKMSPRSADISVEVETTNTPIANSYSSSKCSRSAEDFGSKKICLEDLGSNTGQCAAAGRSTSQHGKTSIASSIISAPDGVIGSSTHGSGGVKQKVRECPICADRIPAADFPKLTNCGHRPCALCLVKYLHLCIMESRTMITCPECHEFIHVADIYSLLTDCPSLLDRYECFSLRRALSLDPDTRWCPAPDCPYAVVAHSCAACPQLQCERPGCGASFCYHCKGSVCLRDPDWVYRLPMCSLLYVGQFRFWHHNQTCDQARQGYLRELLEVVNQRHRREAMSDADGIETEPGGSSRRRLRRDIMTGTTDVMKACPRCGALIVKMNDGSCNHMVCALCGVEFCWLCLKQINELHYLSPTGCTFWGKKPWTRKKKLLWQIGTLIGAPLGIALIAGLAVPGIICGVPIFVGRKTYQRFSRLSKTKRHLVTAVSVLGSLIVSPVLAVMAVGVGVPIMLAYVYGVVPLSLCRDGGCGSGRADDGGFTTEAAYGEEDDEFVFAASNNTSEAHERSHLLHSIRLINGERLLERPTGINTNTNTNFTNDATIGTDAGDGGAEGKSRTGGEHSVTGIIKKPSNKMGTSNDVSSSTSTGRRHNRQQSTESGLNSLGERVNTEDASVKAIAGSHYNYDDSRSTHTIWSSGLGAASYNEDSASTMACGGSVLESRSLAESGSCTLAHHSTSTNAAISGSASTGGIVSLPPPCHTEMLSCSSRMERDVSPGSNVRFATTPMQLPLRSSPPADHHWQRAGSAGSVAKRSQADTSSTTVEVEGCDKESAPIVRAVGGQERSSTKKGLFRRPLASFFSTGSQSPKSGSNKNDAGKQ